ncbi:Transcription factor HES-7.1-A [Larimichthys crocea]|uniref:Uncharacterized protein n=1 Tax=Larimichthys crocea TaxID=215358 RepID=A0ACD3QWC9_LARCR|nr:Transcription factor HES-7.1-A [Larimichthys crocea]
MKLLQETEDPTNERKFIKSQVEKRRRERMNQSLERLRTMLLQEPQKLGGSQHRVEKAEILEHTVLFLQDTAKAASMSAAGVVGAQKHSFQDGISTCLQRAAHFLGPEGKGLWLGAALDASFTVRFSRLDSDSAGVQKRTEAQSTSSSLPRTKIHPSDAQAKVQAQTERTRSQREQFCSSISTSSSARVSQNSPTAGSETK